jgi:hypothetical protein
MPSRVSPILEAAVIVFFSMVSDESDARGGTLVTGCPI